MGYGYVIIIYLLYYLLTLLQIAGTAKCQTIENRMSPRPGANERGGVVRFSLHAPHVLNNLLS